jgi:AcrR family transcriptional regulator
VGIETQPAPGRRDRKKQQTRAALMSAALRLVDERGLDRVTVEEISAAVDVSPRTFFNYFATKDDAILGDPVMAGEVVGERLLAQPPEIPLVDAVLHVFDPAIEQIQADRDLWLLRMRVIKNNPALLPVLFTRGAVEEERFVAAVAERAGVPKDHPLPLLTAALTGAAFRTAMMRWATVGTNEHLSKYVRESFDLLRNGLKS